MSITSSGIMTSTNKIREHSPAEAPVTSCLLHEMFGSVSISGHLLLIALIFSAIGNVEGAFVQTPTDAIVMVNDPTVFNCSSNDTSTKLTWYHYVAVGKRSRDVYVDKIKPPYEDRFDVETKLASGTCNLLVQRPESNDAGKYECKEDPLETGTSAELTILDSELRCETNRVFDEAVGLMHCGQVIDSDKSRLSCSVGYNGNIEPRMTWNINETESLNSECGFRDRSAVCNATVDANLIRDGSVFTCQITTAEQYSCSFKVSKTIHAMRNITVMEDALCFANISDELQCEFKWFKDSLMVQMGEKLTPNSTGKYKCEVECRIRNKTCAFIAMEVNALDADGEEGSDNSTHSSWWIPVVVVVVVIIVLIAGIVLWMKREKLGCETQPQQAMSGILPEEVALVPEAPSITQADVSAGTENVATYDLQNVSNEELVHDGICGTKVYGPRVTGTGDKYAFEQFFFPGEVSKIHSNGQRWKSLNHSNLIKFYEVLKKEKSVEVVMEYTAGGSIRDAVKERAMSLRMIKNFSMQIAEGMKYLHEQGIVHKDLRSDQIFILQPSSDSEKSSDSERTIKIACFNLLRTYPLYSCSTTMGTYYYSSPEECSIKKPVSTSKSDVWSFGIVIWEMMTRTKPYDGVVIIEQVMEDIRNGAKTLAIQDSWPEALRNVLRECRSIEPHKRKPFSDIVPILQNWQV